jgi:hypothetical protein
MKLVQSESLRHIKGYTLVHRTRPLPSRITLPDLTSLCVRINWYTTCDHALKVSKVDMSNLVPSLNHTPIFEWYVVKCGSKNKYQNDSRLKEIVLGAPNITTTLAHMSSYQVHSRLCMIGEPHMTI